MRTGLAFVAEALFCLLLAGCAVFPLSEAECRPASWRQRGYDDGYSGNFAQDIRLAQECRRRYGIEVPSDEYLAGWRDGYDEWYRVIGSLRHRNP
jgi:hypothetical protein